MTNSTQHLNRWLTPDDVAKPTSEGGYGIAKQTQAIWRMEGKLPYSKVSSRFIRYDRHELDKWLESHAVVKVA
jgi:hypothetical protein